MNRKFGPAVCPVCDRHVYFAEEIRAMGKSFHKLCFRCLCNKTLDSFSANDHDGQLFCRPCYSKNFGPKVYSFSSTSSFFGFVKGSSGRPQKN
ncbi:unnamed protein product [Echinostoma caproni]|uniref:Cysteine-rich protein 1 n=1 Tax=Echinostoma caproni TaxID=27848 RepID=A0A183B6E2_9TREM|nr:unnamed protein product [Echinostoma caproni]